MRIKGQDKLCDWDGCRLLCTEEVVSCQLPCRTSLNGVSFPWALLASILPACRPDLVSSPFLVEDQVSAILQKHLFLPFHPQKVESSLPWLTEDSVPCCRLQGPVSPNLLPSRSGSVPELCVWNEGWPPSHPLPFGLCIKSATNSGLSPRRPACGREMGQRADLTGSAL